MSGITGIIYPDLLHGQSLLPSMVETIKHRGPSKKDTQYLKNVHLASCGSPLRFNKKRTTWLALDGDIVNREEICNKLKKESHFFINDDDTSLLLYAYEAWGINFLQQINGDFSIVIFDQEENTLYLARDRVGKKPLYWFWDKKHFLFASEMKALLSTGLIPQTPANDALASFLFFGYIPHDMSLIKNVNKLTSAHYLQYKIKKKLTVHKYWSYSACFNNQTTPPQAEDLNNLLIKSVSKRLVKDTSTCCFVSGGIGSASIVNYVKEALPKHTHMLSVGFNNETEEDLNYANQIADTLQLPHKKHSLTIDDLLDPLVKICWHLDEPLADPNVSATWKLSQEAAKTCSTVFSGMGSDELLAGHSRYLETKDPKTFYKTLLKSSQNFIRYLLPSISYFNKDISFYLL